MEEPRARFRIDSFTFFVAFGLGSFVGVALSLLAIALVQRSSASPETAPQAITVPTLPPTPPGTTATPDTRARTRTAADVYLGPGDAYAIIGTLARDEAVEIVGRDASSEWVAVRFPPGSTARGWLPVSGLDNVSRLEALAVVQPTPLPRNLPPAPPVFSGPIGGAGATRPPITDDPPVVTPTPAVLVPAGPVDLVVTRVALQPDGAVRVTIGNRGPGALTGQTASVLVRDQASNQELLITGSRGLAVGETVSLTTQSFRVAGAADVTALVDPYGATSDADRSNNSTTVALSTLEPTPTPTPRRRDD
jgi:hypothetical protein